jgi:hypothetical protein
MKVAFQFTGPALLGRIQRLRKDRSVAQFLKDCLLSGIAAAEQREKGPAPIRLERARPEFRRLSAAEITEALRFRGNGPVRDEISRLVSLYAPVLAPEASAVRPAGTLRLDVRCPIEEAAASLAFRALKRPSALRATIH